MAMKQINVAEATELQLDWLVARIEGVVGDDGLPKLFRWTGSGRLSVRSEPRSDSGLYDPSTNWARGGPIKERERISTDWDSGTWNASSDKTPCYFSAPSELVAAMRAHVYSKLGDTAEVPEELL